jgi:acetyl-CoA carboxylase, biotin carboxylase subunit
VFDAVLVANRGEIACRVIRTLRTLGIRSVAVHSDADTESLHVALADESVPLGPGRPAETYLDVDKVVAAAVATGAQAVHPGYGFLSEHAGFARAVREAGLVFVGPHPDCIAAMGDKVTARNLVAAAGVPVSRGSAEPLREVEAAVAAAAEVGYPVMVKASGGGGGIGMAVAHDEAQLRTVFATTRSRGEKLFGSGDVLVEQYVEGARHVEVQVLGLADGRVVGLGERDCSVQRRHQKLAEETPCPVLGHDVRARLVAASVAAAQAVDYRGAGTVEWLFEPATGRFVFLEMNTRLQVEHTVTELVTGLDLVAEQLRVAAGEPPGFDPDAPPQPRGHALQLRVCAEDPVRFLPGPGAITTWVEPSGPGIRVDAGYRAGDTVTPLYDPLLAKLCVHGADRDEVLARARAAVAAFEIAGPKQNLPFFARLLEDPAFVSGHYDTGVVAGMHLEGAPR